MARARGVRKEVVGGLLYGMSTVIGTALTNCALKHQVTDCLFKKFGAKKCPLGSE